MDVHGKYRVTLATLAEGIVMPCLGAMLAMAGYMPCLLKNTKMFVLSRVYAGPVLCSHLATCRVKVGGKLVDVHCCDDFEQVATNQVLVKSTVKQLTQQRNMLMLVEMQVMMAMMVVIMITTTARILRRIMMIIVIYCHHYTS